MSRSRNDNEAVWELAEHRCVYIVQLAEHAGHAQHTIFVDDLDARVAAIPERGIEPVNRETYLQRPQDHLPRPVRQRDRLRWRPAVIHHPVGLRFVGGAVVVEVAPAYFIVPDAWQ